MMNKYLMYIQITHSHALIIELDPLRKDPERLDSITIITTKIFVSIKDI